ncbi:hypothetical protein ACN4EG_18125 [Alkalinema pantanalense CENA528]|uniref:hypothetical protein n=1 Tax=Alkalinema pantanalense TaxID=1620705 RepID=UPI003D6E64E2
MQPLPLASLPFRRRPEPVQFWLAVLCGSLVLHSGLLLGVRRWGAEVLSGGGSGDSIAVELVDAPNQTATQSDFVAPKGNLEQSRSVRSGATSLPPEAPPTPQPQASQPPAEPSMDSVDSSQPKVESPQKPTTPQPKPPNSTKKTQSPKPSATQKPNPKPGTSKPAGQPTSGSPKTSATGGSNPGGDDKGNSNPGGQQKFETNIEANIGSATLAPDSGNDSILGDLRLTIPGIRQGFEIGGGSQLLQRATSTWPSGQTLQVLVKLEVGEIQNSKPGIIQSVDVQDNSPALQTGMASKMELQEVMQALLKGETCEVTSDPNATYSPANKPSTIWLVTVNLKVL